MKNYKVLKETPKFPRGTPVRRTTAWQEGQAHFVTRYRDDRPATRGFLHHKQVEQVSPRMEDDEA